MILIKIILFSSLVASRDQSDGRNEGKNLRSLWSEERLHEGKINMCFKTKSKNLDLFKNYKKDVRPIDFAVAQYESHDHDYCGIAYQYHYNENVMQNWRKKEIDEFFQVFKKT